MTSGLSWRLHKALDHIWAPVIGFALLGLLTSLSAKVLGGFIPKELINLIGSKSAEQILNIIATSMLTVTTFSLSIMVAAYASASTTATPRAFRLLKTDGVTQRVLAGFLGAFVFSIFGIIAVNAGLYGDGGLVVLFLVSAFVLLLIVINLMHWIGHLTTFGRMDDTLDRVENTTDAAIKNRLSSPWLGGRQMRSAPPDDGMIITAAVTGYVEHIDVGALSDIAEEMSCDLFVLALPGAFVHQATSLIVVDGQPSKTSENDRYEKRLCDCFTVTHHRNFEQDPRFGLIVLAEVGSRALSPGVNDPGTAIDVLGRVTRVLSQWDEGADMTPEYPRVMVSSLRTSDLLQDGFSAIARDGAGNAEVQLKLHEMLVALAQIKPAVFADAALAQSKRALTFAKTQTHIESDIKKIEGLHDTIAHIAQQPVALRPAQ